MVTQAVHVLGVHPPHHTTHTTHPKGCVTSQPSHVNDHNKAAPQRCRFSAVSTRQRNAETSHTPAQATRVSCVLKLANRLLLGRMC